MAWLVPAIHGFARPENKTWMPGTRPGMTSRRDSRSAPSACNWRYPDCQYTVNL